MLLHLEDEVVLAFNFSTARYRYKRIYGSVLRCALCNTYVRDAAKNVLRMLTSRYIARIPLEKISMLDSSVIASIPECFPVFFSLLQ